MTIPRILSSLITKKKNERLLEEWTMLIRENILEIRAAQLTNDVVSLLSCVLIISIIMEEAGNIGIKNDLILYANEHMNKKNRKYFKQILLAIKDFPEYIDIRVKD